MNTPLRKRFSSLLLAWLLVGLLLLVAAGCQTAAPSNGAQPATTPTLFPALERSDAENLTIEQLAEEINVDDPIIQATVPAIDLDALAEDADLAQQEAEQARRETPVFLTIDAAGAGRKPISNLIYGVANPPDIYLRTLQPSLTSWGGEGAVRFNWQDGNSWNLGALNTYRNSPVDPESEGNQAVQFLREAAAAGIDTYMVLPTIGWVASNNDPATCSFVSEDGTCATGNASTCQSSDIVANPNQTSTAVDVDDVLAFVAELQRQPNPPKILALLHEPELWGVNHYDVHPNCVTYQEILDTFIRYGEPLREQFPEAELAGPATCCWYYYWNSGAGEADKRINNNTDFLPWFLQQMQAYEEENGTRLLDILDIHYYPVDLADDVGANFNNEIRLRSTRSLWDPTYVDESWIREPIYLIPRMQELIDTHYPDTQLAISEWNFGADDTLSGGLAIADALGIFGREGVYMASYWTYPQFRTPGFWAFKLYTNYDNLGGQFGDISIAAESNEVDLVSTYAALDSETGNLHIMIVNKIGGFGNKEIEIDIENYAYNSRVLAFQYDTGDVATLAEADIDSFSLTLPQTNATLSIPFSSITHLILTPAANRDGEDEG